MIFFFNFAIFYISTYDFYMCEKDLKLLETFNFGLFAPHAKRNDILETVFVEGLDYVLAGVRSWPGYEKIADKMLPINVTKYMIFCIK